MKAKTRILAMLLTVLMIAGMLPLSLFALDVKIDAPYLGGTNAYEERTLEDFKKGLYDAGWDLARFQTFSKIDNLDQIKTINENNGNPEYKFNTETQAYCDYNIPDFGAFHVVNVRESFSIVSDGDNNKALLLGSSTENIKSENYISCTAAGQNGYRSQDFYLSLDLKMKGDKILSGTIFSFVYRTTTSEYINGVTEGARPGDQPMYIHTLSVNTKGELYIGDNIVGRLSKEEYTRVSVATDRLDNKVYVYVNDVLVTPGGIQWFTQEQVDYINTHNTRDYDATVSTVWISDIRVYGVNDNKYDANGNTPHDGLLFDNLAMGNRVPSRTVSEDKNMVLSNFANVEAGANITTSHFTFANGGNLTDTKISPATVAQCAVDYEGHKAIKLVRSTAEGNNFYFQTGATGNKNFTLSFKFMLAENNPNFEEMGDFVRFETTYNSGRNQKPIVKLDPNGDVWACDPHSQAKQVIIGKLTSTEYHSIRVDCVTQDVYSRSASFLFFFDDELKYVGRFEQSDTLQKGTAFILSNLRFATDYKASLFGGEMMKDISFGTTSRYNKKEIPFAKQVKGFAEYDGVVRYYDGNGNYATEDFFIGTTKYMVGNNGEILSKISGSLPERSLDEIKTEFAKQGLDLRIYQSFEKQEALIPEGETAYEYPASGISNTQLYGAEDLDHAASDALINYKNYAQSFGLEKDSKGNTALLFHKMESQKSSDNDTYLDLKHGLPRTFSHIPGDATHDLFISIDLKMGGANIASAALFGFVYRPKQNVWNASLNNGEGGYEVKSQGLAHSHIYLSEAGGIYASSNFAPDQLLGFLSRDEYTRIAIATDRLSNKLFVYINDVLVTPDGITLFTQAVLDELHEVETACKHLPQSVPIDEIRIYSTSQHVNVNAHKGLYMDNILYGARQPFTNNTNNTSGNANYSYDIAEDYSGDDYKIIKDTTTTIPVAGGVAYGTFDAANPAVNATHSTSIGTWSDGTGTIRYVDENDDGHPDAIELHKQPAPSSFATSGEAFFSFGPRPEAKKGSNISVSVSVKAGQSGYPRQLIGFRNDRNGYAPGGGNWEVCLNVDTSGNLVANVAGANKVAIAKLSTTEYTEARIDVVCNSVLPTAFYYIGYKDAEGNIDWELKASIGFATKISDVALGKNGGYGYTDFQPNMVRFLCAYSKDLVDTAETLVNDQDLRIRAFAYQLTDEYDNWETERISVFESKPAGLHGIGGVYRYYNGDGTFATKNFTDANGVKYIVGFNGSATRESDGREFAPYAPYVDWQHSESATYIINNTKASNFSSQSAMTRLRDVVIKDATLNDKNIMLITSYKDDGGWVAEKNLVANETSMSGNSYMEINPDAIYNHDAHMVLEFDLMLGELFTKADSPTHAFFQVCGGDVDDKRQSGGKTDYQFLSIAKDGWLIDNNNKTPFIKLSKNEFTRISVVFHTPQLSTEGGVTTLKNQMTIDVYANGVLVKEYEETNANMYNFQWIRFFQMNDEDFTLYVKNLCMYVGEKPHQFVTMKNDVPTQTTNLEDTPARAADIKNGFVQENGIVRYYNELGLPVIGGTISGTTVTTDKFGKVPCDGSNHVVIGNNGACAICGTKIDGVTSLYGHNLVLKDDVKVNFYLNIDIDNAKAEGAQVIVGVPGDKGRTVTLDISELEEYPDGGENCYVVSFPVPAKDIGVNITAKLEKEGETFTEYSYSAQTYIDAVKVAEVGGKITQELKDLVTALDEYGKNAAAVLAGGQQMVAIDDSEVDWNTVAEASGTKAAGSVVRLNTFSLDLKSKIRLRVYFEITSGSLSDYTVTVDESEVNAIAVEGNIYCIDYAVYAKELNTTVDIEIAKGEETMLTLSMAPLYYAKIMAAKYTGDNVDAYKNLMKAIKLYSDAAIAYANSQQPNE